MLKHILKHLDYVEKTPEQIRVEKEKYDNAMKILPNISLDIILKSYKKVDFDDFWDSEIYFSKGNFMFLGGKFMGEIDCAHS